MKNSNGKSFFFIFQIFAKKKKKKKKNFESKQRRGMVEGEIVLWEGKSKGKICTKKCK